MLKTRIASLRNPHPIFCLNLIILSCRIRQRKPRVNPWILVAQSRHKAIKALISSQRLRQMYPRKTRWMWIAQRHCQRSKFPGICSPKEPVRDIPGNHTVVGIAFGHTPGGNVRGWRARWLTRCRPPSCFTSRNSTTDADCHERRTGSGLLLTIWYVAMPNGIINPWASLLYRYPPFALGPQAICQKRPWKSSRAGHMARVLSQ